MEGCFDIPQINENRMTDEGEEEEEDELGTPLSSSDSSNSADSSSSSSDFMEDATSSSCSSSSASSLSSPPPSNDQNKVGALCGMSSLTAQLPFKRGLSKHFQGKSQSFTSLSKVRCLGDLAKPDRPYKKRLKPCKSYGWGLDGHKIPLHDPKGSSSSSSSKTISKKPPSSSSKGSFSSIAKRQGFLGTSSSSRPGHPSLHKDLTITFPPQLCSLLE